MIFLYMKVSDLKGPELWMVNINWLILNTCVKMCTSLFINLLAIVIKLINLHMEFVIIIWIVV